MSNKASPYTLAKLWRKDSFCWEILSYLMREFGESKQVGWNWRKRMPESSPGTSFPFIFPPKFYCPWILTYKWCKIAWTSVLMASSWGHILFNKRLRFYGEQSLKGKFLGRVTDQRWGDSKYVWFRSAGHISIRRILWLYNLQVPLSPGSLGGWMTSQCKGHFRGPSVGCPRKSLEQPSYGQWYDSGICHLWSSVSLNMFLKLSNLLAELLSGLIRQLKKESSTPPGTG